MKKKQTTWDIGASPAVKADYLWEELEDMARAFIKYVLPSPRYPKPIGNNDVIGSKVEYISVDDEVPLIGAMIDKGRLTISFTTRAELKAINNHNEPGL